MRTTKAAKMEGGGDPPVKPGGGYKLVNAGVLAAAWWAYRRKRVGIADLRVWFAAHEADARRRASETGGPSRFNLEELRVLAKLSVGRLRGSVRALESAGLLRWSEPAVGFPEAPEGLFAGVEDRAEFEAFLGRIPNRNRKVPVPRRILRFLASGARPALVATVVGYLLRGLYLKSGRCFSEGRVKASWISEVFGVAVRRVKEARRGLIDCGWVVPLEAEQWALNKWGARFRIDLEWSRRAPKLAPPRPRIVPKLAPPESDEKPPYGGEKDQKPAAGGPAGFFSPNFRIVDRGEGVSKEPAGSTTPESGIDRETSPVPAPTLGAPELRAVVAEDLKDTGRLLTLYEQAASQGLVASSERDRLRVVSAAEHARAVGTRNPCGLFVRLVRSGLWSFLTQRDEDAANARLKRHLHAHDRAHDRDRDNARPADPGSRSPAPSSPALSEDARLVRAVCAAVAVARYRGHPFPVLRRERPEWTRERWDRAAAELESAGRVGLLVGL